MMMNLVVVVVVEMEYDTVKKKRIDGNNPSKIDVPPVLPESIQGPRLTFQKKTFCCRLLSQCCHEIKEKERVGGVWDGSIRSPLLLLTPVK
jgi:hypothetical protein